MFRKIKIIFLLSLVFSYAYALTGDMSSSNYIYVKKIVFEGALDKEELKELKKISNKYIDKKLDIKQIKKLKNRLSSYFKSNGKFFSKVIIPSQNLTNGVLKFYILRAKVRNVFVEGNRYYSSEFIKKVFGFKEGDYLRYRKMLKSMLILNQYGDLKVKSYLKKGSDFGTTDVYLKVEDEKPFHSSISFDNYGSQETAKNRVNLDVKYGNALFQGDEVAFKTTLGLSSSFKASTRLFSFNYATPPLGDYYSRLSVGYIYADYITTGDLSALDLEGDTKIFNFGLKQPLYYSTVLESDLFLTYYKKNIKSYILGDISTTDWLNSAELKLYMKYMRITDVFTYALGISRGINKNSDLSSRLDANSRFVKYNFSTSYAKYINPQNSFKLSLNTQYTKDRLPLSELLTSGIKGTDGTKVLGDSGISTKAEWTYRPKSDFFDRFSSSLQFGLSINYIKAFSNDIVPGEAKSSYLTSAGSYVMLNVKKRYFGRISFSMPVDSSDDMIERKIQIYGYIGMKLW